MPRGLALRHQQRVLRGAELGPQLGLREQDAQRGVRVIGARRAQSRRARRHAVVAAAPARGAAGARRRRCCGAARRQFGADLGRRCLQAPREFADDLAFQRAFGQQRQQRARTRDGLRAAFGGGQCEPVADVVEQEHRQRLGVRELALEGVGAECAHIAVGVVFGGQEQELDRTLVGQRRQRRFQRARGRAPPGTVAVEGEHDLRAVTEQPLDVFGGARGAQRGDDVLDAVLGQRDDVEVALDDQRLPLALHRGACLEQPVQLLALVEEHGFRRIQVLGLAAAEHAAAESDQLALRVADREGDAVAQPVVAARHGAAGNAGRLQRVAVGVARDDQAALHQRIGVVVRERRGQSLPVVGRVTEAEARGDAPGQAAPLQVVDRAPGFAQAVAVMPVGLFEHVGQALPEAAPRLRLLRGLRIVVVGQAHAELAGEFAHAVAKTQPEVLHQEA
ncbi:hypothetical protein GALL_401130 [mine drainage metagenome]|uniref:Uncharacterized protein n=1 Tax=mine drainage metagenome TaxID=410659 RepID=A0A1J5Q3C0_9ZZZZ